MADKDIEVLLDAVSQSWDTWRDLALKTDKMDIVGDKYFPFIQSFFIRDFRTLDFTTAKNEENLRRLNNALAQVTLPDLGMVFGVITQFEFPKHDPFRNIRDLDRRAKGIVSEMEALKDNADKIAKDARDVAGEAGRSYRAAHYKRRSREFNKRADGFFYGVCGLIAFIFAIVLATICFRNYDLLLMLPPVSMLALYLSFMERRYRFLSFKYQELWMAILSLPAYLNTVKSDEAEKLKIEMARLFYGNIFDPNKSREKDMLSILKILKEIKAG